MPHIRVDVLQRYALRSDPSIARLPFRPPGGRTSPRIPGSADACRFQDAVHRGNELDQLIDRTIARFGRELGVDPLQLELVEDCVLALFLPVIQEHS